MSFKNFNRFLVIDVYSDNSSINLTLRSADDDIVYKCVLSGVWSKSRIKCNQYIHIVDANYDHKTNTFVVNNINGMVVISPDVLVTSTSLMSSNYCMRKAWLSNKYGSVFATNKSMIIGNIIHQLFQYACEYRLSTVDQLSDAIAKCVDSKTLLNDCLSIGLRSTDDIMLEVSAYIPHIVLWLNNYMYTMSPVNDPNINETNNIKLQVMKVHDIEESVWNTKLGLKGKIDLTVNVMIHNRQLKQRQTIPLELKTGKPSFSAEHCGQVSLYSLMMEESTHCNEGFLLYLKDGPQMRRIITNDHLKRDLIHLRNEYVNYLNSIDIGPKPLNNSRICSKCDRLFDCTLYLKTIDTENLIHSNVMSETLVPQSVSHLSDAELDFFKKWMSLLHLELSYINEKDVDSTIGFWNESSIFRENKGLGLAKLVLIKKCDDYYIFGRSSKFSSLGSLNICDNSIIRQWERVCLSVEPFHSPSSINNGTCISNTNYCKQIAIGIGFVKSIDSDCIELVLNNKLNKVYNNSVFRIDHLSTANKLTTNFSNLLSLFDSSNDYSKTLRDIIIDRKIVSYTDKLKRKIVSKGKHILKLLNEYQQRAVLKALSTDSYILLRGMPGAGKTQTIVALVRLLVALNQSVLITSFTHAAVDNILLKLKSFDIDFVRIGSETRIHKELHSYSLSNRTANIKSVEELEIFYQNISVVASTCLGVTNHSIFNSRTFDYCIIDEASQVLLPTCLAPLFKAQRFMLVGDPKQLPPLVRSETARMMGLDQSLFVLLQNDVNTSDLTIQYRMNSEIMRIANTLTYDGVLTCANDNIANSTLSTVYTSFASQYQWITDALSVLLPKSVIFLDTDEIGGQEFRDTHRSVCNEIECKIVKIIVENLLKYFDVNSNEIGVISPYQKQVRVLRELIGSINIEINTVDQYQGRDKAVIIYSCVRSKVNSETGFDCFHSELLNDERRLNVAVTRAKKKLIIIGSKSTLLMFPPFNRLLCILREDQILKIPKCNLT